MFRAIRVFGAIRSPFAGAIVRRAVAFKPAVSSLSVRAISTSSASLYAKTVAAPKKASATKTKKATKKPSQKTAKTAASKKAKKTKKVAKPKPKPKAKKPITIKKPDPALTVREMFIKENIKLLKSQKFTTVKDFSAYVSKAVNELSEADVKTLRDKVKKAKKKQIQAGLPKRTSAFCLFVKAKFQEVKAANPGSTSPEIMKLIAAEWKVTPESEKQSLIEEASMVNAEYSEQLQAAKDKAKKPRKLSSFAKYVKENVPQLLNETPGAKITEIMGQVSLQWKQLSEAEKAAYKA